MTTVQLRSAVLGIASTLVFAGCGAQMQPAASTATQIVAARGARAARVLPATKGRALLYVSSTWGGGISVLTFPGGKPVGHIPYDGGPYGLCTDRKGDVYAMGVLEQVIVEYAHGGIDPIATLSDAEADPEGCAVDPGSGNLAVAVGSNEVQVYAHGRGTPKVYSDGAVYTFFFCTYDDKGNLYVTGENEQEEFMLAKLPKGGSTMQNISVDADIPPGYAIQWDGKHVALEAAVAGSQVTIDRLSISGSSATIAGSTNLAGALGNELPAQFWIDGDTIALIDDENDDAGIWKYPAGGNPLKTLDDVASGLAIGITVSR